MESFRGDLCPAVGHNRLKNKKLLDIGSLNYGNQIMEGNGMKLRFNKKCSTEKEVK